MSISTPAFEELQALQQNASHLERSFTLPQSLQQLWPQLNNTDLMNQALDLAAPEYHWRYDNDGNPHMEAETSMAGLTHRYYEFPYEWEKESYLQVERVYSKGLFKYLKYGVQFQALDNASQVTVSFDWVSKVPDMVARPVLENMLKKIQALFESLSPRINAYNYAIAGTAYLEDPAAYSQKIQSLQERWQALMPGSNLPRQLAEYMYTAPERYALHLRPFELATLFQASPDKVLELCLLACQNGDLEARWAILCNSCWGAKSEAQNMHEIKTDKHFCESCNHHYEARLDYNLELVFAPHSELRQCQPSAFCAGSPANTPQIRSQHLLWPGQELKIPIELSAGSHHIWCNKQLIQLTVQKEAPEQQTLDFSQLPRELTLAPNGSLNCQNATKFFRIRVEDCQNLPALVSAAHVYTLQEFHENFSDQIPAPQRVFRATTQLFVSLHWSLPESESWIAEELHEIFQQISREFQGAAVYTPDHNMAHFVFAYLPRALESAEQMLNQFQELQMLYQDTALELKMILHASPCEVFAQDGKLAFGLKLPDDLSLDGPGGQLLCATSLCEQAEFEHWLTQQDLQILAADPKSNWQSFKSGRLLSLSSL